MRFSGSRRPTACWKARVVDSLADERAFIEKVLVDIGHGVRVRIDPASPPNSCAKRSGRRCPW